MRRRACLFVVVQLLVTGCARPTEPVAPSDEGYGYGKVDDPGAGADAVAAKLPTSCVGVPCAPPRVCRLLSTSDPAGVAHAYCLGPDDALCKLDPEICQDRACGRWPELCK